MPSLNLQLGVKEITLICSKVEK